MNALNRHKLSHLAERIQTKFYFRRDLEKWKLEVSEMFHISEFQSSNDAVNSRNFRDLSK